MTARSAWRRERAERASWSRWPPRMRRPLNLPRAPKAMENERCTILVVDDDREMSSILVEILSTAGYRALSASSGADALALVRREHLDLVISDLRMVGMSGHQLQAEIKRLASTLPVVIITAFGSIQTAVESMK